ncbi:MAG TPA: SRPBCC family protein [Actinomycetota bacterium]
MSEPQSRSRNVMGIMSKIRRGRRDAAATATFPAAAADVWRVVSDVERIERWWPRALGGMIIDGDELGREQIVRVNWGRVEGRIRQRVIEWEPGSRYGWEVVSESAGDRVLAPLISTSVLVTVERDGVAGTRVTIRAAFDPVGARGVLALRQISRLARRSYRAALRNLRGVVAP